MQPVLRPIGTVRSRLTRLDDCPKNGDEGAPEAWIDILPEFAAGLDTLEAGQELTLVTWLHLADRDTLAVHPRGDTSRPMRGVFNTRSPARPNPLGLHDVRLLGTAPGPDGMVRLLVAPLEALHGTPVVDIKTSLSQRRDTGWGDGVPLREAETVRRLCHTAWQRGLLSGFNGNVSLRLGATCLVTCTGAAKGGLSPGDLAVVDIASGKRIAGGKPSSELAMHLEVYRRQPRAQAIVHTHPPRLLALGLRVAPQQMLHIDVYEAQMLVSRLGSAPAHAPGTQALADAVGDAAVTREAVWMERHGLVCWGETPMQALALGEELEHLAGIHLSVL